MGKYMRKAKSQAEVAVMDVSQSTFGGVRTRAKTLALQNSSASAPPPGSGSGSGSSAYLQLRSRRLFKPPHPLSDSSSKRSRHQGQLNSISNSNSNSSSRKRVRVASQDGDSEGSSRKVEVDGRVVEEEEKIEADGGNNGADDVAVEASFDENVLDTELQRERSTRESTPCNLIRNPDAIRTPGSSNRPPSSIENRVLNSTRRIPTTNEMDAFFDGAEREIHEQFIEKYNYDPVNDRPLPGRYQWEKVDP